MNDKQLRHEFFEIMNVHGDVIHGDIRFVDDGKIKPVLIVCHSFMAFKDWGFFPYVCEQLALSGFVSVIFNFSLNGVAGNGNRITEFAKFERNTFSREIEDLDRLVDAVFNNELNVNMFDTERIGLLGHSRGGGISIAHSAHDVRIKALVTLSSISTFDRWREHQKAEWRKNGFLPLAKNSTISPLRLGIALLEDAEQQNKQLSITNAASLITIPWLIVHGKADVIVQSSEAESLYQASAKPTTSLQVLEHVGHLYNASTVEEDYYQTLNTIIETIIQWFHKTLERKFT